MTRTVYCFPNLERKKEIFYCSESNSPVDKLKGCKRYELDIMIDDRPSVALFLAENGIKVLMYNAGYNQDVEHENIMRVDNWEAVYRIISELTC